MKRKALLLIFAACLAFATRAGADQLLFGFTGFDYQDPNLDGTYLDLGEGYNVLGFVTGVGPLLDPYFDTSVNEYTLQIHNLSVVARFFTAPNLTVQFSNGGRASYYADPLLGGTHGTYGVNPPNATAPNAFANELEPTATLLPS